MDPEASKSGRVWDSDCGTSSGPSSVYRLQEDGVCRILSQSLQHQHLKICGKNGVSYLKSFQSDIYLGTSKSAIFSDRTFDRNAKMNNRANKLFIVN